MGEEARQRALSALLLLPPLMAIDPLNSTWPNKEDILLVQHMPKTGGTSFRSMIFKSAARHGKTLQTNYGGKLKEGKVEYDDFNAAHPAQIIMGHLVNFRTLQPVKPGRSLRYLTMVRSPLAWVVSLYLHFHSKIEHHDLNAEVVAFVQGLFTNCKGLARAANGTACQGQLYAWYAGGALAPATTPDKCASFVSFYTHPSHLLLVNERYEDSMWLLYQLLGWGSPPKLEYANVRKHAIYDQSMTLRTTTGIATTLTESCLPDIYAAAQERFEHVYYLARAYCTNRDPCDLSTSELGRRLWTPLKGVDQ